MNIDALTAYLALSSGSYSGILRDMYAVHNLGLNPDLHTKLLANRFVGVTEELTGIPPLSFKSKGKPLTAWSITGNTVQNGTPTPENPVEVQAVGEKTRNLFDKNTITAGNFATVSRTVANNAYYCSDFIPITATTYYFQNVVGGSYQNTVVVYDANKQGLRYAKLSGGNKVSGAIAFQSGDAYIRINCYYQTDVDTVMVNIGSTPLPYEPYGYKIPVVTRGKNLLEPIGFSATGMTDINDYRNKTNTYGTSLSTVYGGNVLVTQANQSGNTTSYTNGFFYIVVDFSKFTTGKNYILSFDYEIKEKHSELVNSIAYIGKVTNFVTIDGDWSKDGRKSVTFTVKEGFNPYIEIRLCGNSIFVSNIQIEEGTTATPYEPYHEPITTPIYLPTPLYSGEVMRSNGTITRSDGTTETFTVPQIPTLNGTTVIDVDTAVKPESMTIKYRR